MDAHNALFRIYDLDCVWDITASSPVFTLLTSTIIYCHLLLLIKILRSMVQLTQIIARLDKSIYQQFTRVKVIDW